MMRAPRWVSAGGRGAVVVATLLAGLTRVAAACPSCKEALGSADRWAAGFNASIYFMMAMPFAVVGVIAGAIYRTRRRRETAGADEVARPG